MFNHANLTPAMTEALCRNLELQNCHMAYAKDTKPASDKDTGEAPGSVDFGFEKVPLQEKERRVHKVFDSVATKYDLMNDVMSLGIHRAWKNQMVSWLNPQPGMRIVDVAGGTGDVADRIVKAVPNRGEESSARVYVCDINEEMLRAGTNRRRVASDGSIAAVCGDAEHLPIADSSVDAYTIAFGIRNVTTMEQAIREAYRVLKPGGRFLCLEFSHVPTPLLQRAYDWYSFNVLPRLGQMIAGDRDAYAYLVESIRVFPDAEEFVRRLVLGGFERVQFRRLTHGIAALHSGWRV